MGEEYGVSEEGARKGRGAHLAHQAVLRRGCLIGSNQGAR